MSARRALLVIRLSHLTDSSTSPERQLEITRRSCEAREWVVAGIAEDLDVSATKFSPFDRPQLGRWLSDRVDDFDVLVCWRLDRLVRSSMDLAKLILWADEHGKDIVSATEGFDLGTPFGRAMAAIIGVLAQLEAETIRLRVQGSHDILRTMDRWASGVPPLGYMPVPHPSGRGVGLAIDPDAHTLILQMAEKLISDDQMSFVQLVNWLNKTDAVTSRNRARIRKGKDAKVAAWDIANVIRIMSSYSLLGYKVDTSGSLRLDSEGAPIKMAPPLLDDTTWEQLQAAVAARRKSGRRRRHAPNPLLGIACCGECGAFIRQQHNASRRGDGVIYRYASCGRTPVGCSATSVKIPELLDVLTERFWHDVAHLPATQRIYVPGHDSRRELDTVTSTIDQLREDRQLGLYAGEADERRFRDQMKSLMNRREILVAEGVQPSRWTRVEMGHSWGETYEGADETERRKLLIEAGLRAAIYSSSAIGPPRPWWGPDSTEVQWYDFTSGRGGKGITTVAIWREIPSDDEV